jgi:hypothetical protein
MGVQAGYTGQQDYAVAIGSQAAFGYQQDNAIAIGNQAGNSNQGLNSIAIGNKAGFLNQAPLSIALNASGTALNPVTTGFFVAPVRANGTSTATNLMWYNTGTKEISYATKTFVIPHPIDKTKYLVHGCLEGPEAGTYYRGKGTITNNFDITIELPEYVKYIGSNFTIQITKIFTNKESLGKSYETSEVSDGKFTVYGSNGSFYWQVQAERHKIDVEPNIDDYMLQGDGPYTYIIPKNK